MVYICEHCHFLFSQPDLPERCPDCGKEAVRPATTQEEADFERQIKDAQNDPL